MKVITFDCDGVLFDSADSMRVYYNTLLNKMGMPELTNEQFAYAHMSTFNETLNYLFPNTELLAKAKAVAPKMSHKSVINAIKMEPSLIALLKKLRPLYKTAIATNRTYTIPIILKEHNIARFFDCIVSADDVARPKPYPDQLFKLLDFFDIDSDQMLYIGDSIVDQQAADAAGVDLVAYKNPSLVARYHIKSLKEIENILHI